MQSHGAVQDFRRCNSKTAAKGEINCLDPGGFGAVTITKSIDIKCDNTLGGILVSGTNGIVINAAATDIITLEGLDVTGLGTGLQGVRILQAGAVHIHNVQIRRFLRSGIGFEPVNAGAELIVDNSIISDNCCDSDGAGVLQAGILVRPAAGGSATITINRTQLEDNRFGVFLDSANGAARGILRDSVTAGNLNHGATATSGANLASLLIDNVTTFGNTTGIAATGPNSTVLVNRSVVSRSDNGLRILNGGQILSFGNNVVTGNTSEEAFSGSLALK